MKNGKSPFYFEVKETGKNLDKEHPVFNLVYMIDIFKEFYPEEFFVKKSKKDAQLSTIQKYYHLFFGLKSIMGKVIVTLENGMNSNGIYLLKLSLISSKSFKKVIGRIELMEENIGGEIVSAALTQNQNIWLIKKEMLD